MTEVKLFNEVIKKESDKYFLIFEAGTNHYELADYKGITPYDAALEMIREASKVDGVSAIKFQSYKAEKIAHSKYSKNQYDYMRRRDTLDAEDYIKLIKEAKKAGINFMTTVFDLEMLKELGSYLNIFKVASPDITNYPLLEAINEYKKPVILSTAGAEIEEIWAALEMLKDCNVVIMHCRAIYPTPINQLDLGAIRTLNKKFKNNVIGYSNHSFDASHLFTALALGANVLETHFKLDVPIKGGDYPVSITPNDIISVIKIMNIFSKAYGNTKIRCTKEEEGLRINGRRGLYAIRDLEVGDRVSINDFIALRPTMKNCLQADDVDKLKNKKLNNIVEKGYPIFFSDLRVIND